MSKQQTLAVPMPFDERGWDRMLDEVGSHEFYDGIVSAVVDE